jgi:hypothetical protein
MPLVNVANRMAVSVLMQSKPVPPHGKPEFSYSIVGNRAPTAVAGFGITFDVDEATYTEWTAANPSVAGNLMLATDEQIAAAQNVDPLSTFGFELGLVPPTEPPIEPPFGTPPVNVDVPYAQQEGGSLTCTMGNWSNVPTGYHYTWWQDGTMEIGTDSNVLDLVSSDAGHTMTCVVQAYNAAGFTDAPPSNGVVVTMPTGPTPGLLISGAFDDAELAGLVGDIGSNPSAWLGFDVLVDGVRHTLRAQFPGIATAQDICDRINAQLGAFCTTTMPATVAPWQFVVTSNTTGSGSSVSYCEPPSALNLYDSVVRKGTTDISVVMRLRQATGAVVVPGADAASEAARARTRARVPASVA